MSNQRVEHLTFFYALLFRLETCAGGTRTLSACSGRMPWPRRGIYFFQEPGETRSDSGTGPRIVRVGTHALTAGSGTKLWTRLAQHKGPARTGGGNHRGSIFRLIIGNALIKKLGYRYPTWGQGNSANREIRQREHPLEIEVSQEIGKMPFLSLAIDDDAGPGSKRGYIERNAIALVSNFGKTPLDPPSQLWLGRHSERERVRSSGLWNSNHVVEQYDPAFLGELERLVSAIESEL